MTEGGNKSIEVPQHKTIMEKIKKPITGLLLAMGLNYLPINKPETIFAPNSNKYVTSVDSFAGKDINKGEHGDVKIYYEHMTNNILCYTTENGTTYAFTKEAVDTAKNLAKETGEPELIGIIPFNIKDYSKKDGPIQTEEYKKEKISQCVSDEELKERGIRIFNSETKLYIRPSAFEKDGVLEKYKKNGKESLNIYLANGPTMSVYYLPNLPDAIKKHICFDYDLAKINNNGENNLPTAQEIRQFKIKSLSTFLQQIQKEKKQTGEVDDNYFNALMEIKLLLDLFQNKALFSDKQCIEYFISANYSSFLKNTDKIPAIGHFINMTTENNNTKAIVIATGQMEQEDFLGYYAKPDGSTDVYLPHLFSGRLKYRNNCNVESFDSHPNKNNLHEINLSGHNYKYGSPSPGFTLQHEVQHDKFSSQGEENHEYKTDERAAEVIQKAYDHWKKSGYTDDSQYPFIIEGPNGEITITKAGSQTIAV